MCPLVGLTQWRSPTSMSIHFRGSERKESVVICGLPLCWKTEDEPPELGWHGERKSGSAGCCTVREATCARGTASYRLHSSTSLSLTVWGRLTAQWQHLALRFPFVKMWLHWITITTSTSCPLCSHPCPPLPPPFPASLYPFSTPSPIPPAGSYLNDTLSICLIISPLATLLWPSLGSTFFWKGGAKRPKALQLDFLTAHLEGQTLCDTINPSLPSSNLRATSHRKMNANIFIVYWGCQKM